MDDLIFSNFTDNKYFLLLIGFVLLVILLFSFLYLKIKKNQIPDLYKNKSHKICYRKSRDIGILTVFVILLILLFQLIIFFFYPSFLLVYGLLVAVTYLIIFFFSFFIYKDKGSSDNEVKDNYIREYQSKTRVSIIIPVKNEEGFILKCINSFKKSNYDNREIIVVNDCSTDNTLNVINDIKGIKILNLSKNIGKKRAIAEGIKSADGDVLVLSDSDSIVYSDAINRIVYIFDSNKNIGGVSGHVSVYNIDDNILTKIQSSWYEGQFRIRKAAESVFGAVSCISGPLSAVRREAVYNYIPAWTEDKFLGIEYKGATDRMLTSLILFGYLIHNKVNKTFKGNSFLDTKFTPRKWDIEYSFSAVALTVVPNNLNSFVKQQLRWKKNFIRMLFFTPFFYWRRNIAVSIIFYSKQIFTIAGPFIVFRQLYFLFAEGDFATPLYYLFGLFLLSFLFTLALRLENPFSKWYYRPFMTLISTFLLTILIIPAILTVRQKKFDWRLDK